MNTLITIGVICLVGLVMYCAPSAIAFVKSFIKWHFGGRYD